MKTTKKAKLLPFTPRTPAQPKKTAVAPMSSPFGIVITVIVNGEEVSKGFVTLADDNQDEGSKR